MTTARRPIREEPLLPLPPPAAPAPPPLPLPPLPLPPLPPLPLPPLPPPPLVKMPYHYPNIVAFCKVMPPEEMLSALVDSDSNVKWRKQHMKDDVGGFSWYMGGKAAGMVKNFMPNELYRKNGKAWKATRRYRGSMRSRASPLTVRCAAVGAGQLDWCAAHLTVSGVTQKDCVQLNGGFLDKMAALVAEKGFRMRMSAAQMFTFVRKARSAAQEAGARAVDDWKWW